LSLLSLPTVKAQRFFEDKALKNGWNARELGKQIKARGGRGDKPKAK
jgi:predicted nuclease of restriction endonuclease-like (RecB) superfamily